MNQTVLVTGGCGYIGSHTTLALLQAGLDVVVVDNLSNSSEESLKRVAKIAGRSALFVKGDIEDQDLLEQVLRRHAVKSVLHFAAFKSVSDSINKPLAYYQNNVAGTLTLCRAMEQAGVFRFVFSSSGSVYGKPKNIPLTEETPTEKLTNPYSRSKLMIEEILRDLALADARWSVALLRYFNPVGAHESGTIGEDPNGIPSNLVPFISQVVVGKLPHVTVFGDDYPTRDGTGIRDYLHVVDLADGHVKALQAMEKYPGANIWNLGTGKGQTVLEILHAFEREIGKPVPYKIAPRRGGDVAESRADVSKAQQELGWTAQRDLDQMVKDSCRWQSKNPNGYR